jgi:hypothetical protein
MNAFILKTDVSVCQEWDAVPFFYFDNLHSETTCLIFDVASFQFEIRINIRNVEIYEMIMSIVGEVVAHD